MTSWSQKVIVRTGNEPKGTPRFMVREPIQEQRILNRIELEVKLGWEDGKWYCPSNKHVQDLGFILPRKHKSPHTVHNLKGPCG